MSGLSSIRHFLPRLLVAALVIAAGPVAPPAAAQDDASAQATFYEQLEPTLEAARLVIAAPESNPQELESMRENLLGVRGKAVTAERLATQALAEAKERLTTLGPAPADGAAEPPEVTSRRAELSAAAADAQVPLLKAQDATRQIDDLIRDLDRQVWDRVSAELRTRGPSPVLPSNWRLTYETLGQRYAERHAEAEAKLADPEFRSATWRTLLRDVGLVALALGGAFLIRRRFIPRVERALARATSPRAVAWLVVLRNMGRLVFPAIGAGLLFAALDLTALEESGTFFHLPVYVLVIIGAGWLSHSLFSPKLARYRLLPLGDVDAVKGARLAHLLGGVLAAQVFVQNNLASWELTPVANATLNFPLILLGGYGLWGIGALHGVVLRNIAEEDANLPPEQRVSGLGRGLLRFLGGAARGVAIGAPLLAATGFFAAANAMLYPMILTLTLFGANLIVFDLIRKTGVTIFQARHPNAKVPDGGLGPVVLVTLLSIVSAPFLALIWGARVSDLASFWLLLREGGSVGGIRISAGVVVSFIVVFALCLAVTRALKTLLGTSVLPRTKLDAGGKNAVLAGVGYLGFAVATLVSISATGLDLSNIAIIAGALSVGIGFGLQNIVSNFVSGIILLVERPVKEGDWIEVGTYAGYVRKISVRSTEVETFDRATVILPNSDLVSGTVLNRTHTGMTGRIEVPVSVTYDSDARTVAALLLEIVEEHPLVLEDPAPRVLLMNLGPDTMDFEIRCWLRDVNFSLSARSDINFDVVARLNKEGIRMQPFQRDIRAQSESISEPVFAPPADLPASAVTSAVAKPAESPSTVARVVKQS